MTLFLILYVFATLALITGIIGSISAYDIKVNINLCLASLIGAGALVACAKLAVIHLGYYLIYGLLMAAFMVFLTTIGKAKLIPGTISCSLSFIFWPHLICFLIFSILNMQAFLDKNGQDN